MWKKTQVGEIEPKLIKGILETYPNGNKLWTKPLKNPLGIPDLPMNPNFKFYDKPSDQALKGGI